MATSALEMARDAMGGARRVVALTGAGISTDSGVPDFRGPQGVWTKDPAAERRSTLQHYLADTEVRKSVWRGRLDHPAFTARPNPGHRALVDLEHQGRLVAIVTQNIDELHQRAGSSPDKVIELHGTVHGWRCWSCGATGPMLEMLERVRAGEEDPPCEACGGIVKSTTISFGQALDPAVLERAEQAVLDADLVLAVGSTLTVYPAAGFVPLGHAHGARVVIVNADPTPHDGLAVAVVRGSISDILPVLVAPGPTPATGG
jgi:NAD-dependent deacetylase